MAKLLVKIDLPTLHADQLQREIDAAQKDPEGTNSWVSRVDGLSNILVDEAYLNQSKADDSFFVFELVGVVE